MTQPVLKTHTTQIQTESGMLDGEKAKIAEVVKTALTDTFHLLVATQGVHWNVQGPLFCSIHKLTEAQYQELFSAIDELAERIRALGQPAPSSLAELSVKSSFESPSMQDDLESQITKLVQGHETIAQNLRLEIANIEKMRDAKTADIFTHRIGVHEEAAWMLRAIVSK